MHPRATLLLLAAVALPAAPLMAQDQPPASGISVPPVTQPDPIVTQSPPVSQPPVTQTTTPVSTTTPPPAATTPTPATEASAAPERRAATRTARTARTTARAPAPARTATPARQAAPAAAAAAPVAAAAPPAEAAPPVEPAPAVTTAPLPVPEEPAATENSPPLLMWAIGGGLLLLLGFALFSMLRHRRRREAPEQVSHDERVAADPVRQVHDEPAPMTMAPAVVGAAALASGDRDEWRFAAPATVAQDSLVDAPSPAVEETVTAAEEAAVADAHPADVEALAAGSAAPDGRPWLEFMMRPVRAGTSKDSAIVEFELTVGNTGDAPARDVRISTFMFAAGAAGESEMERMLIDPPADAAVTEVDIAAGDATRVDATMSLSREGLSDESVLPVVVADARYRLPDGTEGHTRAQFEVGIPSGEGLDPFPTDRTSGLLEGVEARLHGEPERV